MATGDGSEAIRAQIARQIALLQDLSAAGQDWVEHDVKPEAQRLVPVLTGATRDSIDGEAGPQGIVVFAGTTYADVIEFGSSTHAANPFLLPAINRTINKLGGYVARLIERNK